MPKSGKTLDLKKIIIIDFLIELIFPVFHTENIYWAVLFSKGGHLLKIVFLQHKKMF